MKKSNYSKIYRLMHWAIAISFMLLLITIFLRLTWMNKNNVSDIIQEYLKNKDLVLTQDESIILAKKIRKPMWEWHIYLGYVLTGLMVIRMLLPFFGEMKFQNPFSKNISGKDKFKKWTYLVFYFCVFVSLVTGLFLEFGPESLEHTMEDIHVLSLYYLIPFIVLHFSGILIAEFTEDKGIVSRIISGFKTKE